MTISQITQAFERLSAENQLMLLDHLGELTEYVDEITEGLRAAAIACGRCHAGPDDEGDEAETIADSIMPRFAIHTDWKRHAAKRDRTLAHALTSDKGGVSDVTRASA